MQPVASETMISTLTGIDFVLVITGVPALRAAKTVDTGERNSGRIVEPHELRIGRLESGLDALGDLLCFLRRPEAGTESQWYS